MTSHTALLNETDRTVALVIAYTPLRNGVEILAQFTPERQSEIVCQLAKLQAEEMPVWSRSFRYCCVGEVYCPCPAPNYKSWHTKEDGTYIAVRLLERLDGAMWQAISDSITRKNPELADNIRERMVVFEDITRLYDPDVSCMLKNIEVAQWAIALQSTSEELREKIYKNMSKRAAIMLQEEIEYHSPQEQSHIEFVQREIVHIMRLLSDAGELILPNDMRRW
jgi:flagellar motor switch protein FliG